jgi:hypothetical protein
MTQNIKVPEGTDEWTEERKGALVLRMAQVMKTQSEQLLTVLGIVESMRGRLKSLQTQVYVLTTISAFSISWIISEVIKRAAA